MKNINLTCIIDDDPIFVFGTKKLMQSSGYCKQFLVFENGKIAIEHLSDVIKHGGKMPEIILLDLNMPVMDGWQFLDAFIKKYPNQDVHIFIVTSSIDQADIDKAASYKLVSNYVVKPLQRDQILEMIQATIDGTAN
ncbi:MAG: response regulator [Bacteroidetes bacterium]|nr:response regulator [Bacteroidota bacterium]